MTGGLWKGASWAWREFLRPYRDQPATQGQFGGGLRILWLTGEEAFQAAMALIVAVAAIVLSALLYGLVKDIPLSRVIVAIFGAAVFWALVDIQLLYRFRPLGDWTSRAFGFLLASFLAFVFGAWLINWAWLDKLLKFLTSP